MSNQTIVSGETRRTRELWKTCCDAWDQEFRGIYERPDIVHNEEDFRAQFSALSSEFHGEDSNLNKSSFDNYHDDIHLFVRTIDKEVGLSPPSLKELFFTSAFAIVKTAAQAGYMFAELKPLYKVATDGFPKFVQTDLMQYRHTTKIQNLLQEMFAVYFRTCLELLRIVSSEDEEPDFGPFNGQASQAKTSYAKMEADYRAECEVAARIARQAAPIAGDSFQGDRYEHIQPLGEGSFGKVDIVREITTESIYARKQIKFNAGGNDPSIIENRVRNEAEVMTKLRHNHIAGVQMWFKTDISWTIIMLPVADYDLTHFLKQCSSKNYPRADLELINAWFGCLASALTYAHGENVKHEDIKPSNILVKQKKVYLTDFGSAKDFGETEASTTEDYLDQGSPIYWPPDRRPWGRAADVFALGCVFSEMLTVRQGKSLKNYREFRADRDSDYQNAFRHSLEKVAEWLTERLNINDNDPPAQTILEQTLNMLIDNAGERSTVSKVKNEFRKHNYKLFCSACQ